MFLPFPIASQVLRGPNYDKALVATSHPCSKPTLYRKVQQARAQLYDSAKSTTKVFLENHSVDVKVPENNGGDSGVSSLSPSPNKKRRSSRTKETDKTVRAIKDGVLQASLEGIGSEYLDSVANPTDSMPRKKRVIKKTQHQANVCRANTKDEKEELDL